MSSRILSKRLAAVAPSVRCARSAVVRTAAPSARSFSALSRSTAANNVLPSMRKFPRFVNATSFLASQTRSYADQVVKVPQMAESISEGTLKQFTKQIGDYVAQDEEIATIETDKIDVAVNAPTAGTITEFLAAEEDTVVVGQDLLKIKPGDAPEGGAKPAETAKEEPKAPADAQKEAPAKQEAKEPKQEAPQQKAPESQAPAQKESPKPAPKAAEQPKQAQSAPGIGNRAEQRVKMNRMRRTIASRLKESQNTAASLTTFNEIDMSALMDMRKRYKDAVLEKTGVKLGFMSAFSRAAVQAMKDVPAVNASIDGEDIVYRDYVDISVAVATPKGLVTPVVRNAESLDMVEIEQAIADLGKKARDNKITIEDMVGGTFTISNGGVFGSLFGTPIINLPQTAVLGLHTIKEKPVAVNGKVEIRPIMVVALTYDHRLLDGKEAVTFLVKIKNYIEDPRRLLLGV